MNTNAPLRSSTRKLYDQIATLMRREILEGQWKPGDQIPTLQDLVKKYGVARITVRQAVTMLEKEGLVWRRQGKGTFVVDQVPSRPSLTMHTDWKNHIRTLEGAEAETIAVMDTIGAPDLKPGEGAPARAYHYMRKVLRSQDVSYAAVDVYLDRACYEKAPERFDNELVMPLLESLPNIQIGRVEQTLTIATADMETATLLEIPANAPVGRVRRIIQDKDGTVIYFGDVTYRGDYVKLQITVEPDS